MKKCPKCGEKIDDVCLPCESIKEALESFPMEECIDVVEYSESPNYDNRFQPE